MSEQSIIQTAVDAATARIAELEQKLAHATRPIKDRRPGAGPATRSRIAYEGLTQRLADYGNRMIDGIGYCVTDDDLRCNIGEPFAYLMADNERHIERLDELEKLIDARADILLRVDAGSLTQDQLLLIKGCIRRAAAKAAAKQFTATPLQQRST